MKKDQNYIAKVEQAIAKKYGEDTVQNPKKHWNEEKEKEYLQQLKDLQEREDIRKQKSEKVMQDDVLVDKRLITKRIDRTCPVCSVYSFSPQDDLYINRFECCKGCYIEFVEGREERWATGWRPDKNEVEERRVKKNHKRGS